MCGIAGMFRLDGGPLDPRPLGPMLDPIRHRGPDGRGTWACGPIALGHVRLSVIDLTERAHQPMLTQDEQGVLAYNGEVYNFRALREELEREGAKFESHGDTAVVLEALHRWGPEVAVPRFDGMFAFAYFDRRDQTLWLARDRFGIKMLSTTQQDGQLIFCSEIKGILAHPAVTPRVDRSEVTHFLVYGGMTSRATVFENVRTLDPGTLVRVRGGVAETRAWYDVVRDFDPERVMRARDLDPADAIRAIERTLTDAVRSHLVGDAPLATMCSGGVDSSLVTALAREARPDIEGFTADVGGTVSEWAQAEKVGRHLGVRMNRIRIQRDEYLSLWPECIWHRDIPNRHPSDPPMLSVVRACRDLGFKVLVTGEGSDEVFAGYSWYRSVHRRWRMARRYARLPLLYPKWAARWRRWEQQPHNQMIALDDPDLQFRLTMAVSPSHEFRRLALHERLAAIEPPEDRAFLTAQLDDLRCGLGRILHRHDRIGMAASIEMRLPFLANEVADLGLHLPPRLKLHRRRTKWVLKRLAESRLPPEIVHAPKKGFSVAPHLFTNTTRLLEGGFVPELLRWTPEETRRVMAADPKRQRALYQLVSLEIWGRIFFRGEPPGEVAERLLALDRAPRRA